MVINWRLYLTVAAITSAFLLGGYLGYTNGPGETKVLPMVITKTEVKVEEKEKIVYKDRAVDRKVVTEKKADGSVTEVVEEKIVENEKSKEVQSSKTETKELARPSPGSHKKYSLGLGLVRHWDRDILDRKLIPEYSLGYGMTESVWLKVGIIPADKIYSLGIEFKL